SGPMRRGLRAIGEPVPDVPGTHASGPDALRALFRAAGYGEIETTTIDVTVGFPDFESYWHSQLPSYSPTTKAIAALRGDRRSQLQDAVREELGQRPGDPVTCSARANAIKARAA